MASLVLDNNGVLAPASLDAVTFAAKGVTATNCKRIVKIGNPTRTFDPAPGKINSFTGFVTNGVYNMVMKQTLTIAELYPPLPGTGSTSAYRFSSAAQNIALASPTALALTATTPFFITFRGKLTASGAAFRMGRYNGSTRVWDLNFKHEAGVVQLDFQFQDSTDSTQFLFSSTLDTPLSLNTEYLFLVTGDGILGNHAAILVNNINRTSGENETNDNVQALATGGTLTLGRFATYDSVNADIRDFAMGVGAQINGTEATELYNGGTRKSVASCSFYSSKVTVDLPLASDLVDTKAAHSGTATTPAFV